MEAKGEQSKTENPHAKSTYRVLNEPFKLMGILDWRYAFCSAVPAVFAGLFTRSRGYGFLVFCVVFCVVARRAYEIASEDADLPLVLWATLFDKKHLGSFKQEKKGPRR
jgi:hypothetical protein